MANEIVIRTHVSIFEGNRTMMYHIIIIISIVVMWPSAAGLQSRIAATRWLGATHLSVDSDGTHQ